MAPRPFFSVLIPSYNRPEYLPQAVASVLANDFPDFELVVSDNHSPRQEEIRAALAPFAGDHRLVFVAQPENLGEARNRHCLMQRARGAYRIILGDDDLLGSHALSTLHLTITSQPGYDLYLFGYAIIDEDDRVFETRRALAPLRLELARPRLTRDLFCADLHPFWFYHPATFCFPASLHHDVVPDHSVGIGDDVMFLCDALLAGKRALVMPVVLFSYRKFLRSRGYAQTNLSRAPLANLVTRRHILYALLERRQLPPALAAFVRTRTFRKRFLYHSVLIDPDATAETAARLELAPAHRAELEALWRTHRGPWFHRYLQLRRIIAFARYFGPAGLLEVWRIARERRAYARATGTRIDASPAASLT